MTTIASADKAAVRFALGLREAATGAAAAVGNALGSIFFIPRPWIGLLLWIALLREPRLAVFALWGLGAGAVVKKLLRIKDGPGPGGGVKANALLASVVTAWMTGPLHLPGAQQLAMAAAAATASALVAAALMRVLSRGVIPALLGGYCLVAVMLFSICPQCTVSAAAAMPPWPVPVDALGWAMSFLRSMGSLMYSADPIAGACIALAILLWSRTMFLCGVAGWIAGNIAALGFQGLQLAYYWLPLSYNFFIAGMALGAALFLPGRQSLPVAVVAGAATAFIGLALQYAMEWSSASYLPLSSALAIWVGAGALTLAGEGSVALRNTLQDRPPEDRWWDTAYPAARFGRYAPLFAVPAGGPLQVSQGFGGKLSHQGPFGYALDFQRPRPADGGDGSLWGAPVTSPVSGSVERVRNTVPDNPLGVADYAELWGNYVVIRVDAGGWALLAHLQQGSIAVVPGARVETGSYLARVGNSGRSPVPHLHMQLQDAPEPGAPTRFFRLANYLCAAQPQGPLRMWKAAGIPAEGDVVMAAARTTAVYLALVGITPGSGVWVAESAGRVPRPFRPRPGQTQRVNVSIDSLGQHVFETPGAGKLVARLDPDAWRIAELSPSAAPILELLALAAPSVPYAARSGMAWKDLAPAVPKPRFFRAAALVLAPYAARPFPAVTCACVAEGGAGGDLLEVSSLVKAGAASGPVRVSCQFAPFRGPVKIRADFKAGSVTFSLLSYEPGAHTHPEST